MNLSIIAINIHFHRIRHRLRATATTGNPAEKIPATTTTIRPTMVFSITVPT